MVTKEQFNEYLVNSKDAIKDSTKTHKKAYISIGVIIGIIALLVGAFYFFTSEFFIVRAFDALIPTEITASADQDTKIPRKFYREKNPDYDPDKYDAGDLQEKYLYIYNFYYLDINGEKQYVEGGTYRYTDDDGKQQSVPIAFAFLYQAGENLDKPLKALKITGWSMLALVIIIAIYIWYRVDKKRQQLERQKSIQKNGATKKKR